MDEGDRVELSRDVERYPHFIAPEGSTGVLVQLDEAVVRLDEDLEGAEEWDNKVLWAGEHRAEFEEDVGLLSD